MNAGSTPPTRVLHLQLRIGGADLTLDLPVPDGPVTSEAILPTYWAFTESLNQAATDQASSQGRFVSCQAGCGACCRQLVPISVVEAQFLAHSVATMPETRRASILARFHKAIERLEQAGLLHEIRNLPNVPADRRRTLGLDYFRLGLPCPFLENESCSIHAIRPLVCREYLVSSPAKNCANPTESSIDRIPIPVRLSGLLRPAASTDSNQSDPSDIPLVLALEWAGQNSDPGPRRPGPEWAIDLVRAVSGRTLPPPADLGAPRPSD